MNMRWLALLSLFMLFMVPMSAVRAQDAVDCQSRDGQIVLRVKSSGDVDLEQWAAERAGDFSQTLDQNDHQQRDERIGNQQRQVRAIEYGNVRVRRHE